MFSGLVGAIRLLVTAQATDQVLTLEVHAPLGGSAGKFLYFKHILKQF